MIAFTRGERFVCIVNFGPEPIELPAGAEILVGECRARCGNAVPQDTTVWLVQTDNRCSASGARNSASGGDA